MVNGHDHALLEDLEELQDKLTQRNTRIAELEVEHTRLAEEVISLRINVCV